VALPKAAAPLQAQLADVRSRIATVRQAIGTLGPRAAPSATRLPR